MLSDPVVVALNVAQILESCGLRYLVGGSLASSMSGEPRSTLDVDIVVAMSESDVGRVTDALRTEFDVDELAVGRAVRERSSVNVFHRSSAIKVDFFIMGRSPFDEEQMNRRQRIQVTADPNRYLYTYTPEDILLQKLRWFRKGTKSLIVSGAMCWASCSCRVMRWTGGISMSEPNSSASPTFW